MKLDEFAFVNQQLASMLRDGIPLEGALRQVCEQMHRGELRAELETLEAALANGRPLADALRASQLPLFYVSMIQVGARANDLPGILMMVAEYYQRLGTIWVRLKGLMVYPLIVLFLSLTMAILMAYGYYQFVDVVVREMLDSDPVPRSTVVGLWGPLISLSVVSLLVVAALTLHPLRRWFRWHLPAFKETTLTQFAAAMATLLKGGCTLDDAIVLMREMEGHSPARHELDRWLSRLSSGQRTMGAISSGSRLFPQTFLWLVAHNPDDPATGFARAAQIYQARAIHKVEMMLYAALPVMVLVLGFMLAVQFAAMLQPLILIVNQLGSN